MASHGRKQVAQRHRRISEMRFSAEPVSRVRAAAVARPVCYWIMDIETIRSLGARSEKTREPEKERATLRSCFLHKTCKTRTLHRASTILYVARLLAKTVLGWRASSVSASCGPMVETALSLYACYRS